MRYKYYDITAKGHNVRCKAYFTDRPAAEKAVVFCTGFAGHRDNNAAAGFAEKLLSKRKDTAVIVFDWPAHGEDVKKKPSLEDCMTYLDLVTGDAVTRFGARELYCYATSFGGYLVLKYITERDDPFRKIALRCPAVDMYGVLTNSIMKSDDADRLMKGKDVQAGFDRKITVTRAFLDELKANDLRKRDFLEESERILIIHGTSDEVVPFEDSRAFAEDNLIEFIAVEKADHRFQNPLHMSLANKHVMEFFGFQ
ncbi:MAG: alpha/beta fold hydrolase [Oscillospiraceae bacterium]|nr:alpha/beta fold hydrolase [Oscillospiraceae bacterium]